MIKTIQIKGISLNAVFLILLLFGYILQAVPQPSTVQVQLMSPQPNSNVEIDDVIIVFSILKDMEKVNIEGVRLEVDNVNVGASVQLNQGIISFLPLDIKLGGHSVKLSITDTSGRTVLPISFSFNVIPSVVKFKPERTTPIVRFSGQNSMTYQANDVTGPGADARQEPESSNSLNVTATGSYEGINYEASAVVSSESNFNMQPTDTYSFKVYTDWGGLTAGDNFPSYSSLVMSGNRIRGASAYAQLDTDAGKLKIDGVYGQSLKRIESQQTPARTMQAINASYNYNDVVKINAIYLKSDDDEGEEFITGTDYFGNTVMGASIEYSPSYDFKFQVNYAKSDTEDLRTGENTEVDTTGKAFIGNDAALDAMLNANIGTIYTLNARYSIAGLNYKSFGNPWKSVDLQTINASNTLKFFNSRFTLTGVINYSNDNLSENKVTTTEIIMYNGSGTISLGTNLPTLTGNYSFNTTQSENKTLAGLSMDRETIQWSTNVSEMLTAWDLSFSLRGNYGENNQDDILQPTSSNKIRNYGGSMCVTLPNYAYLSTAYNLTENSNPSANNATSTKTMTFEASYPVIADVLTAKLSYQMDDQTDQIDTINNEKNSWEFNCLWDITSFQRLEATYSYAEYSNLINPTTSNYKSNSINLSYTIMFDDFSY